MFDSIEQRITIFLRQHLVKQQIHSQGEQIEKKLRNYN